MPRKTFKDALMQCHAPSMAFPTYYSEAKRRSREVQARLRDSATIQSRILFQIIYLCHLEFAQGTQLHSDEYEQRATVDGRNE